jgi:hypothetical protein
MNVMVCVSAFKRESLYKRSEIGFLLVYGVSAFVRVISIYATVKVRRSCLAAPSQRPDA